MAKPHKRNVHQAICTAWSIELDVSFGVCQKISGSTLVAESFYKRIRTQKFSVMKIRFLKQKLLGEVYRHCIFKRVL